MVRTRGQARLAADLEQPVVHSTRRHPKVAASFDSDPDVPQTATSSRRTRTPSKKRGVEPDGDDGPAPRARKRRGGPAAEREVAIQDLIKSHNDARARRLRGGDDHPVADNEPDDGDDAAYASEDKNAHDRGDGAVYVEQDAAEDGGAGDQSLIDAQLFAGRDEEVDWTDAAPSHANKSRPRSLPQDAAEPATRRRLATREPEPDIEIESEGGISSILNPATPAKTPQVVRIDLRAERPRQGAKDTRRGPRSGQGQKAWRRAAPGAVSLSRLREDDAFIETDEEENDEKVGRVPGTVPNPDVDEGSEEQVILVPRSLPVLEPQDEQGPLDDPVIGARSSQDRILLESKVLNKMAGQMAGKGWNGRKIWEQRVRDRQTGQEDTAGPKEEPIRRLWELLSSVEKIYGQAPRPTSGEDISSYDFTQQNAFLHKKGNKLETLYVRIPEEVNMVCSKLRGGATKEYQQTQALRKEVTRHLRQYHIPMIVLTLKTAFGLGGTDDDPESPEIWTLLDRGSFGDKTLPILARCASWLRPLVDEVLFQSDLEAMGAKGGTPQPNITGARKLKAYVADFAIAVDSASAALEDQLTSAARREQRLQRAEAAQLLAQGRAREAAEARARQFAAFCASTQALRDEPDPLKALWKQALPVTRRAPTVEANQAAGRRKGDAFADEGDPSKDKGVLSEDDDEADPFEENGGGGGGTVWFGTEESDLVLKHLRKHGKQADLWSVAVQLDRKYQDVVEHAELLKKAARALVREGGGRRGLPSWAETVKRSKLVGR